MPSESQVHNQVEEQLCLRPAFAKHCCLSCPHYPQILSLHLYQVNVK